MLQHHGIVLVTTCFAAVAAPPAAAQDLPSGVAAGDVTPESAVLWARASTAGPVVFTLSADRTFSSGVRIRMAVTPDALQPVKAGVRGLAAGTRYYYRAVDAAGASSAGSFVTPHPPGEHRGLHFGVTGDSRGDLAPFIAMVNVPARQLDLMVELGDTIYADIESPALPGVSQAAGLDEFRIKHAEVLNEHAGLNALADMRRHTSLLVTIDDHEVTNDFAGGAHPSSDTRFSGNVSHINETQLYRDGLQAFHEYHPIAELTYGPTGDPRTAHKRRLYRARWYGDDAVILLLDARSFRDAELAGAGFGDVLDARRFITESFDPARTMLGRAQLDDLKSDLLAADAGGVTWKFVMVPEPIQNLGVVLAADRFEGYAAERTELLGFIASNQIDNVVFVAADIHGTVVNDLTYQTGPGGPQLPTGAFEITTGAIAFEGTFGPTIVVLAFVLGQVTQGDIARYLTLPPLAREHFIQRLVNDQLAPLGYDPVGLEPADQIDATLVSGSWTATHSYGWTEFEIDRATQMLRVTTWGVDPQAPGPPAIVQEFVVRPRP